MTKYSQIVNDCKKCPKINHKYGTIHFSSSHNKIFRQLQRVEGWKPNDIRLMKHYIVVNRLTIYQSFKKVFYSHNI
jgi:hypothetical protein